MKVKAIVAFRLVTAAPARLAGFYAQIGFRVGAAAPIASTDMKRLGLAGAGSRVEMSLGAARVDLDSFEQSGQAYPGLATACDLVFQHLALVTDNVEAAWRRAVDAGALPISRAGPVTLPSGAGGVTAAKFRDPEGHPLELLQFPRASRADGRERTAIGVDHSAISVGDVEKAHEFYMRLGLARGKATVNQGPTQAALDGLDAVTVDVVPLAPAQPSPHLELLGYRHPQGHKTPPLAVNDVAATRVLWRSDTDGLIRDPDGHLHELTR
jgi:catechol 2,3-dioxygenase-like lactoylglutathione lyase family enzyme